MLNLRASLLILALLLSASTASAATLPTAGTPEKKQEAAFPDVIFSQSDADKAAMDIHPSRYADFWKTWHFVTVRWRQDIREFRFVYANDLAWKTLSEHRTDYPVGAMFGKLIYPSEDDLALPSSVLPSNLLNRLEIQLWDPDNKKAGSDGWVYLRFINTDPRSPKDKDSTGIWGVMSDKEIKACVECHTRAYDRRDVFSQPLYLFRDPHAAEAADDRVLSNRFGDLMKDMDSTAVPRIADDLIRSLPEWQGRKVKGHEGDFFTGSLGEISPVLARLAEEDTHTIFMVYDRDDPNTMELASSLTKKGYEHCAGIIRLSGATRNVIFKRDIMQEHEEPKPDENSEKRLVQDLTKQYKPAAMLYTICGQEGISRRLLPLLYKSEDQDGLPTYTFAPIKSD